MMVIKPEKIYISSANVDMRNSIDGLSTIVEQKFRLDVFSDAMFVFHNRHCDKVKLLYWDGNGFCLLYKRKKAGKKTYAEKYGNLPVEEVIYDIPEEEKICKKCGFKMSFMKYEIRKELKIVPAKITVVEHKRAVYVCKNCDKNGTEGNIITTDGVPALMEKSLASPSILSYIMNQKYCNGLPLSPPRALCPRLTASSPVTQNGR